MKLQKIVWKINFQKGNLDTDSLFRFFNSLIENSPQVFVDIADYKHVPEGPIVVLVGVNADVGYDSLGGELGLSYNQKKMLDGSNQEKLKTTFSSLISIYDKMSKYEGFLNPPVIDLNKIKLIINDRALAPNTQENFDSLNEEIQTFFSDLLGRKNFKLKKVGSEQERLSVEVHLEHPLEFTSVLKKMTLN